MIEESRKKRQGHDAPRRTLIARFGAGVSLAVLSPATTLAAVSAPRHPNARKIAFHHLHTGEKLRMTYWRDGNYDRAALSAIDELLRDFRTGDIHPIERGLLDILVKVQNELAVDSPYQVIGGYRSPKTNQMLRTRSQGVAKRSLHMQGRAIDVRIPGLRTKLLREAAADLSLGGVGYYPSSDFVHIDTGRPRVW